MPISIIGCAIVIVFYDYVNFFISFFSKLFDFYYLFMNTASIIQGLLYFFISFITNNIILL